MNGVYFLTASAALIAWSMAPVYGAPKSKDISTEARAIFEQIDIQAATAAETAFHLKEIASSPRLEDQINGLRALRETVNHIGEELRSLEADRDSLSGWEREVLDKVLPLMREVAVNTEEATNTFNSHPRDLWTGPFMGETSRLSKNAADVSTLVRENLKLAKTRENELRLEQSLGETAGF